MNDRAAFIFQQACGSTLDRMGRIGFKDLGGQLVQIDQFDIEEHYNKLAPIEIASAARRSEVSITLKLDEESELYRLFESEGFEPMGGGALTFTPPVTTWASVKAEIESICSGLGMDDLEIRIGESSIACNVPARLGEQETDELDRPVNSHDKLEINVRTFEFEQELHSYLMILGRRHGIEWVLIVANECELTFRACGSSKD